ncbi:MAG: TonB-dependent receptor [Rheinheimera sp.]|uniref:TonB-dependent receptor plug domain-containing protein n=1 Tax=Arsukibacterium sp. UBA3155 TaxID=1946058 RepID=UPI000C92FFDD|nr:TonB-dependent receptor [Arsukibacterium sp. UBA3155]MAD74623.1 TonB-dependent receptor [Rheinheimera sp.]|tara:strand:+ start:56627 stop:59230 length:2604 start_codon:yes stop_codon:yes gene_type:complete
MYFKAKMKLSTLSVAVILAATGQNALAAEESTAEEQEIEKIQITGSRLKGVDMEGANPVQVFSREDMARRGYDSVGSFLRDLPQASSAGTFTENGGVGGADGSPAGSSGVSLRGLGSSSTLVLVNGRRVAVDSFTNGFDSFVNVNAIPMSALERVEVLTDGASSVYGSDAIAGVINFILRKDVEGHEVSVSYGDDTKSSNFGRTNLTYVGGFNTENSNTTLVVDYFDRNALFNSDRPIEVTLKSSTRVSIDGSDYAEPWCGDDVSNGGTRCRYDYVIERAIQPDTTTLGATLHHNYQLANGYEFFAEAMFQNNTGSAYDSAAAFDVRLAGDSSLVPQWAQDIDAEDGTVNQIRVRSRFPETRIQDYDTTSYRLLAGLRGELGMWSWETAATYGKTDNEITHVQGYMGIDKVNAAIASGSFNPFNLGRDNSESAIAAVRELAPRVGESEVYSVDFNIAGDLAIELPAGNISAVFGGEFRSEDIFDRPADIAQSGGVFALGASDAAADRTQYAAYGEFNLPLTDELDMIAALRYDHYSDFGGDVNPKLSLRYRATDDLIVRASWSTGFRAPSLSQLGAGESLSSAYINCGANQPFDALCGDFGATAGELELDQETLGNRDLNAENSEAVNVGFSWNLTDKLQITADYWRYEHTDIVDVDANTTLKACIAGIAPVTSSIGALNGEFGCVLDAGDDLVFLRTGFFNVGSQQTDGIDVKLDYRIDTDSFGSFKLFAAGTKTFSYERQITPDSANEDLLGKLSGANEIARPDFVADFGTDWSLNNWTASLSAHYISELGDGDFKFGGNETVDAWLVFSGSVGYEFTDSQRLLLTVRNLTDEKPPYASSPTNGYASSVHDWIGTLWTVRYTVNF